MTPPSAAPSAQAFKKRRILVTSALPYANGQIHIGHLLEQIQTDIWCRFQRLMGHECHYLCADDTHGTPIMIAAKKRGITPEALIQESWDDHVRDSKAFEIDHALYGSTHSEENRKLCELFFSEMEKGGHLAKKSIDQLYCEHDKMFLPDRFVKGTCPKCGALDQYGDSCDVCSATYAPTELKNPKCAICGNPPVIKQSEQLLFKLENFRQFLTKWLPEHTQPEVCKKMMEWFNEPLRDWDISRNAPYFGFQIPGHKDKYFYVWVDAPMGYVSTSEQYAKAGKINFDEFWRSDQLEVYHFIGKDITYFHTLFWPALLHMARFRTPTKVFAHGMLMVKDAKMSKSKGTMIPAALFAKHLDTGYLRYYYASKMGAGLDDMEFSFEDFTARVNSDLVGKITNLGSRGGQMLGKEFASEMTSPDTDGTNLLKKFHAAAPTIAKHFDDREYAKAVNEIRALADDANRYFDEKAPWKTLKTDPQATQRVLSSTLNFFRILAIFLKPILPSYVAKVEKLFQAKPFAWADLETVISSGKLSPYEHLIGRIDPAKVALMMEENKPASQPAQSGQIGGVPLKPEIEIDAFNAVDLRVGLITGADTIPEADKLLKLTIDLGPLGSRQIFAGIKAAYDPAQLVGRKTVVVANLKPRQMKFGISQGMVLAAGAGGKDLFILSPDDGAKPGDPVK